MGELLQLPEHGSALEALKRKLLDSLTRGREQPHCLRVPSFARLLPAGFRCVSDLRFGAPDESHRLTAGVACAAMLIARVVRRGQVWSSSC